MSSKLNKPSGSGFYGRGYWGNKVFWLNVPGQWRELDEFGFLRMLLNTWGDLGEDLLEQISLLPLQRDPYKARAIDSLLRWFYVTESMVFDDPDKGHVVRLIGERKHEDMPETDIDSPPDADESRLAKMYPWFPYEPLKNVARYWELRWKGARYEVENVRLRNYDQPAIYRDGVSLANEVWVKGGDLTFVFDFITNRIWGRRVEEDSLQGCVQVGTTDGSFSPSVELPTLPVRLERRASPTMVTTDATVQLLVPMEIGWDYYLYDVPDLANENMGTLNLGDAPEASTTVISSAVMGSVDYLSGEIQLSLDGASMQSPEPPAGETTAEEIFLLTVAVDNPSGACQRTIDAGKTWTEYPMPNNGSGWLHVEYGDGILIAVSEGNTDKIARSETFGESWELINVPSLAPSPGDLTYADGIWVVVGLGRTIIRSSDKGKTWIAIDCGYPNNWNSVNYGNGVMIACAYTGGYRSMRSLDRGLTWTGVVIPSRLWTHVAYGNGTWIIVGYTGIVMRSRDDGLTWTQISVSEGNYWNCVRYVLGRWVAVARDGTHRVMLSLDDGLTWVMRLAARQNAWRSVEWVEGDVLVAVSRDGVYRTMRSEDAGETWTAVMASSAHSWNWSCRGSFQVSSSTRIEAKYKVRGYYMPFNAPPTLDYLAQDFGFLNDQNDPVDVQRSTIANITKFWGLKSTQDSYRIRGEISLFDVELMGLYRVSIERAAHIDPDELFEIEVDGDLRVYTSVRPRFLRYDHISSDEQFWDAQAFVGGVAKWVPLVDNMILAMNESRWDGMSIAQGYAVDVAQGYYGRISPFNGALRGPVTVSTTGADPAVEQLSQMELDALQWANGYRYRLTMKRAQYEAFNFSDYLFALSVYDYNVVPASGTPPAVSDLYYYIDRVDKEWTADTTPTSDPKEDVGEWWVLVQLGEGVASPISVGDDVAVRYVPGGDSMDCGYCRSNNMRALIGVSEEAYSFYDNVEKVDHAIDRLKGKLLELTGINERIIEYEIVRRFEDSMRGVQSESVVKHSLDASVFEGAIKIEVSIRFKGESDGAGKAVDFRVLFWDDTVTPSVSVVGYSKSGWQGGSDYTIWQDVETGTDLVNVGGSRMEMEVTAGADTDNGEIEWLFNVTKREH